MNALQEFFSREAGQRRRAALDGAISNALSYYLGPTGMVPAIEGLNYLNPVRDMEQAGLNAQRVAGGDAGAIVPMITDMASVLAPAGAVKIAGGTAANALAEGILGFGGPTREGLQDAARRFVADEEGALTLYRGTNNSGKKITGGIGEGYLFASPYEDVARLYGDRIETMTLPDSARVLTEGSPEFAKITGRKRGQLLRTMRAGENLKSAADDAIEKARAAGYDAVEFNSMRDMGVAIINPSAVQVTEQVAHGVPSYLPHKLSQPVESLLEKSPNKLNPATDRAQSILDLLTSGRASEVTDDMLDLGDPVQNARLNMYLFDNYDLPMDEASRMARAGEMGFRPGAYRGAHNDVSAFSESPTGRNFVSFGPPEGTEVRRAGTFFSDSPAYADEYAATLTNNGNVVRPEGAVVGEYMTPRSQPLPDPYDVRQWAEAVDDQDAWMEMRWSNGGWEMLDDEAGQAVRRYSGQQPNFRGAYEFEESIPSYWNDGAEITGNTTVVFDPRNIRSRFARFDPRLAHLRNLSAGLAGAAVLTDEGRAEIESFLSEHGY